MTKKAVLASFPLVVVLLGATRAGNADPAPAKPDKSASSPQKMPEKGTGTVAKAAVAGEATLAGDLTCAKCGLHESTSCQNVLVVKESGGKTVKYYLAKNGVAEENHEKVCDGPAHATVTGRISEAKGKKVITASSVKID